MLQSRSLVQMLVVALALVTVVACSSEAATIYNAGVDLKSYQATGNPGTGLAPGINTVVPQWSYGTETGPDTATPNSATFTVFPASTDYTSISLPGASGNMAGWQYDHSTDLVPVVAVNTTGSTVTSGCCGSYGVDQIWTHPGSGLGNAFTVVRWTAPSAGNITVSGTFLNEGGVSTRDYVLVNGVQMATGNATAPGSPSPLTVATLLVPAGTTIDFITGQNAGGYGGNSTSFNGTVTFDAVPEPATAFLLVLGTAGLLFVGRKRRV